VDFVFHANYDLTTRGAFFLAESLANKPEAPEVVPAVFAADGLGSESEHEAGEERRVIKLAGPPAEIHAMAHGAFGVEEMTNALDAGSKEMPAILTAKQINAKKAEELAHGRFLPGKTHFVRPTFWTFQCH
jgi:hypothetical protein